MEDDLAATETPRDLFEETREAYKQRLDEIEPLVAEAERIRAHLAFMDEQAPTRRTGRRRRGNGGGRMDEFVSYVKTHPGQTIAQIAKGMSMEANYLYRIGPAAAKDGKVAKRGKEYFPAGNGNGNDS